MQGEDNNALNNFGSHENEDFTLKTQDIERDNRDLVGKDSDTGSRARDGLSGYTPQDRLLVSESSSSLRGVKFGEQEFPDNKPVSNVK